jgi:hypothetical protein
MSADDKNLKEVERTYKLIKGSFDTAYQNCETDEQKERLIVLRDAARDAYFKGIAENLSDSHDLVKETIKELGAKNDEIQKALKSLKDISAFLNIVTAGVKLAAAVVTLAAV